MKIKPFKRIAVSLDFSKMDSQTVGAALAQGGTDAEYLLIHVIESAGALIMRNEITDYEFHSDRKFLEKYRDELILQGYNVQSRMGFGNPKKAIPLIVKEFNADLLVMGAHGHKAVKDFLFGTTVDTVRHRVDIPCLIVRKPK